MKDITGRRNGRLVAIKPLFKSKNNVWQWECKCDCGNTTVVSVGHFKPNGVQSCGCIVTEHARRNLQTINKHGLNRIRDVENLSGQTFGYLKVIDLPEISESYRLWECECICGNHIVVSRDDLKNGNKKSCGCKVVKNEYEFTVDTCIGYTLDNKIFLVDIDKYDIIKNHLWSIAEDGYVICSAHNLKLHRVVSDCPKDKDVDHIHGKESRFDNRSCNLRPCTQAENSRNRPPHKNNKLGIKGVSRQGKNKYRAEIQYNHKRYYLGVFNTLKEAADAYDKKAKEFFGEYAWLNNYNIKENEYE